MEEFDPKSESQVTLSKVEKRSAWCVMVTDQIFAITIYYPWFTARAKLVYIIM